MLALITLSALIYGLIDGGHRGFTTPPVLASLAVAVAAATGFLIVQARGRHPMMPLDLFASRGLRIAPPVGFAFMVGNLGNVFVVSLASGPVTNRFGARVPVVAGLQSMTAGLLALVITAPLTQPVITALCLIPIGAGGSLAMPSVTSVVLEGVPAERSGTASAVFNTFRQVGGAVAIAVFGSMITKPDHFVTGMQTSLTIAAACLLTSALISLGIQPRHHR